jgi:hypothetical protein
VLYLDGSVYIGSTTSSATSALQIDANQITSGNGLLLSGNAYVGSSNRGLLDVRSTSTARATNSSMIGVNSSGAVGTSVISRGVSSSVTNSGTNTTNIGFYSDVSGAATNNYSFYGNAGDIYSAGDVIVGGGDVFMPTTGRIGYYGSAAQQTLNIATFAATGTNSKTINIGTGNTSATTNVNIGYTGSGTTTINSPSASVSGALTVGGASTLAEVTGVTGSFSSTLNVGGASTFTGNSTFAGDLTVSGDANFEWQLVGATDNFTTDTFTISSSNIYRADGVTISSFDTNNYDYKFVYYASCNTEESGTNIDSATSIKLRINGITSQKRYGWIAQRIVRGDGGFGDNNFEDTDGTSGNAADDRTSRIHTITILDDISNASSSGQTFVKLEFTISESYAPSLTSGIMMIEGEGNAVFSTTSSVVEFKSGTSKAWFTGTVSGASSLTSVTFLDTIGVTTTSTEFQKVQVYRRKRLTFTA